MQTVIEQLARQTDKAFITDKELAIILPGSTHSRYSLVKRALAKRDFIRIRRGLYCFGKHLLQPMTKVDTFALAAQIYGPSYISLESALAFHQWIPEAVYTITSVTFKRKREFTSTAFGLFKYYTVPLANFYTSVILQKNSQSQYFIATPLKALCDYIYVLKKDWQNSKPLIHSLRIEEEHLAAIEVSEIMRLSEYYKSRRVSRFLHGLMEDLQLYE